MGEYLRTPRSSRMMARADLTFRLIDDPDGAQVGFGSLVPLSVEWERNRPGEADTAKVSFTGDALPFDLGVIAAKSMNIGLWLFEHQEPDRCDRGDPGYFFGVVDQIRRDRYTLEVSLDARDLTAIPLGAKMPEELVKAFEIDQAASVESIVEALIRQIKGTHDWRVESRSAWATTRPTAGPQIKPTKPSKTSKASKSKAAMQAGTKHLADIVPPHELTVWSAICNVCARMGVVPEVMLDRGGDPVIVLIDASDLQTSDVLRPFERAGKKWRVLVDGDGIATFSESLALESSEARPDFVQVDSRDPLTGAAVSARWPPKPEPTPKREERGMFQFVRGETQQTLLKIAKGGFESLAHNQFRVAVTLNEPWSAGGGPESPDLLDLGYGAAVQIAIPNFDRLVEQPGVDTPAKILAARKVPEVTIHRILRAQAQLDALALLFQVEHVRHSWSGGSSPSYTCEIGLRRFLGTEAMPMFQGDVPSGRREAIA